MLRSVGGNQTITISCHPLDISISRSQKLPVVSPPAGGTAPAGQANVVYTFDGQGPILETWDARHESVSPARADQVKSFLGLLFSSYVLHFMIRDGDSIEYQQDSHAKALNAFVHACRLEAEKSKTAEGERPARPVDLHQSKIRGNAA